MLQLPILFGDALDTIIRIAILVFLFGGPLLSQLFKKKPEQLQRLPAKQPPQPQRPPQVPHPARPAGQPNPADRLEAEIEEFLKRAGKKKPAAEEVIQAEPVHPKTQPAVQRLAPARPQPRPQQQRPAQPRRPQRRQKLGSGVSRHVQEHIEADPVGQKSRRLGQGVSQEIDSMEEHVHDVFDHEIGGLEGTPVGTDDDIDNRGTDSDVWEGTKSRQQRDTDKRALQTAEIIAMVRDPYNIRQAIILGEILKRPDF